MDWVWKTLAAPIIVALIGGYGVSRLLAPEAASLHAKVSWVDVENPIKSSDQKTRMEFVRTGQVLLGSRDLEAILDWGVYRGTIRLVVMNVANNSLLRSKDLEVYLPDRDGIILADPTRVAASGLPRVSVKPIDPGTGVRLVIVTQPWSEYLSTMPVSLLHEGKKVHIAVQTATGISGTILDWLESYPFAFLLAALLATLGAFLVFIIVPVAVAADRSPEMRLKISSKSELNKLAKFIDWVRANHPARIEAQPAETSTPPKASETPRLE